jgi:hypothetical protein
VKDITGGALGQAVITITLCGAVPSSGVPCLLTHSTLTVAVKWVLFVLFVS